MSLGIDRVLSSRMLLFDGFGDPTKTLAIFIAVYVFMRGELPDISTDVKMISWDHR